MDLASRLRGVDLYARPKAEYRRGSIVGVVLTALATLCAALLFWRELKYCLEVQVEDYMFVSSIMASKGMNISFDISFHNVQCASIGVDVEDSSGNQQVSTNHVLGRFHLNPQGAITGQYSERGEDPMLGNTLNDEKDLLLSPEQQEEQRRRMGLDSGGCGNCYGAAAPGACCNTCEEVKTAYRQKGWAFDPKVISQCDGHPLGGWDKLEAGSGSDGCRISGSVEVSESEGNLHFAPATRVNPSAAHVDLNVADTVARAFQRFDSSHTVHALSFGEHFPGVKYPLDGKTKTTEDSQGMMQYYTKVVPTTYRYLNGKEVESNQYSSVEHFVHVYPGSGKGLPGVYFYYEVSPIHSRVEEKRRGLMKFMTGATAIVGGCEAGFAGLAAFLL